MGLISDKSRKTHLKETLMLLCGSQNNICSSLVLTVLTERMFTTTAVKCAAVSDQGSASLMFAIRANSKEGSTELQI